MMVMLVIYHSIGDGSETDVFNFYKQAEAIKAGQLPYKDFVFEFPPFALIFFMIPSIFTSDLQTYIFLFGIEIVFFSLVTLYFMINVAEKMKINKYFVSIIFMAFILIYFQQMIRKFDIIVAAFTFISLYLFCEKKYTSGYAVMAFAALVKVYPAFLIPIFIIMNLTDKEDVMRKKNVLKGIVACLGVALVAIVPFILMSVPISDILSFIGFHSNRGFQIESIVALIVQCLGSLGLTTFVIVPSCDTYDVYSSICNALLPYWSAITLLAIVLVLVLIMHHASNVKCRSNYRVFTSEIIMYSLAVIMTFMLVNKVFSTQYVIWIYALITFLAVINEKKINMPIAVLSILIVVFSGLIVYFGQYYDLFLIVNIIRDLMLLFVFSQIILHLLGKKNIFDPSYSEALPELRIKETK